MSISIVSTVAGLVSQVVGFLSMLFLFFRLYRDHKRAQARREPENHDRIVTMVNLVLAGSVLFVTIVITLGVLLRTLWTGG